MKKLIFLLFVFVLSCAMREEFDTQVYFIYEGHVYSMNTDGGNIKRLTNDSNTYNSVSSSPCAEYIILSTTGNEIYTMRYDGENLAYLMDGQYPTYGPSGRIYFVIGNTTIARYDPSNGSTEYLYTMASGIIYAVSCNRDETILAFLWWNSGPTYIARMSLVTPSTPDLTQNITGTFNCFYPSFSPTDDRLLARTYSPPYYITIVSPDNSSLDIYPEIPSSTPLSISPAWTADGEHIYFADNSATPMAVKIMNSDGSGVRIIAEFSSAIDCFCVQGKPR